MQAEMTLASLLKEKPCKFHKWMPYINGRQYMRVCTVCGIRQVSKRAPKDKK